jgi:asparagine synthetase B (glutamine-hydrolysing)
MCGFTASSLPIANIAAQVRGPDETNVIHTHGAHFVHHLLHLTGQYTAQPFIQGDCVCVFNGEIYNYQEFGSYLTDGACLIDLYQQYGLDFVSHLDGEFAIVILTPDSLVIATDPFATKPLHVGFSDGQWCAATYASDLTVAGQRVPGNTVRRYRLDGTLVEERQPVAWDLRQHKSHTDDWIMAFEKSIAKRCHPLQFLGLSSGYDSGAIACELTRQNAPFKAYSIINNESKTLFRRHERIVQFESIKMTNDEFDHWKAHMQQAEPFSYKDRFKDYNYKQDQASVGLAAICSRANRDGLRVYLSGQGADEILSDYGFAGKKHFPHSQFGGLWPETPRLWHSFADGTQIQYLNKEEYTAGHFGIEARYPFLDRQLVQEFLWLTAKVKNRNYKSPLHDYLTQQEWPFDAGKKLGFSCNPRKK